MPTTHPTTRPPEPDPPPPGPQQLRVPVLTLAGARIDHIPATVASTFLARQREAPWTGDIALAMGAVTDSGELVGVAVLAPPAAARAEAFIAVTPARRRLGIGTDLLLVLLDAAATHGLHRIASTPHTDPEPAHLLCRALGLTPDIVRSPQGPHVVEILARRATTHPDVGLTPSRTIMRHV
jgi:GNAT superfamily N-acetyltransferase